MGGGAEVVKRVEVTQLAIRSAFSMACFMFWKGRYESKI